ncbi:MAG TPA: AAA family ATPase [Burkholderiales bacterium]|nr:AAA family ATPase [Burkholderiales bacterium]
MYYAFFGLSHPPFKITPDTDVFFEGGNRGAILEALIYAISQGEGIIKVTGEVGSGKTMLCRMLQARLLDNVETIYLANPSVSPEEILHAIAFELQLPIAKDASRLEVMHKLNAYLLDRHAQGRQVVMFIEESQGMPLPTLEEIRLLSNLETKEHKLLQIVLFGQPELDDNLRQTQIRQLRERITHSFPLTPLSGESVRAYINFRLQAAGYRGPDLFGKRVVELIARASEGLTRRINIIADKALLAAFADGTHNLSVKHVKSAISDSEFSNAGTARPQSSRLAYALGGLVAGGVLGVVAFNALQSYQSAPDLNASAAVSAAPQQAAPESETEVAWVATAPKLDEEARVPAETARAPAPIARSAQQSPVPTDLLEQRLQATVRWLKESDGTRYTVQLLGAPDPELLRNHLNFIGNYLEINDVFVYRTVARERPSMTVVFGSFANRREAMSEIERLPHELQSNRPYFRTIRGIRAEIGMDNS